MMALKCPVCAENIVVDDSREFGFCSYCGTKIRVENKQENMINSELEITRKLIDASLWLDAQSKLNDLLKRDPSSVEALIYLAYVECMLRLNDLRYDSTIMNSQAKAEAYLLNCFDNTIEIRKAKALSGTNLPTSYQDLKHQYLISATEKFNQLRISTKQFEINIQKDKLLLDGYYYDEESDGHDKAFFVYNGQLMFYDSGAYYIVNSVNNGIITMTFDSFGSFWPSTMKKRHLQVKIECAGEKRLVLFGYYSFYKQNTSRYEKAYASMLKARKSPFVCNICGGQTGPFGCKNKCQHNLE